MISCQQKLLYMAIVPGKPTYTLWVINLDVIFGTPTNFRKENIEFEVIDWPSQYHAISPDLWQSPIMRISSCGCPQIEGH
jgi:hypothetical protein